VVERLVILSSSTPNIGGSVQSVVAVADDTDCDYYKRDEDNTSIRSRCYDGNIDRVRSSLIHDDLCRV
jgi:hypothetical protein